MQNSMVKSYFIIIEDKQQGPYDLNQLYNINITRGTLIWFEGLENWTRIEKITHLSELIKKLPTNYTKTEIPQLVNNEISFKLPSLPKQTRLVKFISIISNNWLKYALSLIVSAVVALLVNVFLSEVTYDINKYDDPSIVSRIKITDTRRKTLPEGFYKDGKISSFRDLPPDWGTVSISGLESSDFPFPVSVDSYSDLDALFNSRKAHFRHQANHISFEVFIWLSIIICFILTIIITFKKLN